jgi:hypothetical protein
MFKKIFFAKIFTSFNTRVADPHHFNADPDPVFHLNADPDPTFYFIADPASKNNADPDTQPY